MALTKASLAPSSAANAKTGQTVKGYDTKGAVVYVKPGEYNQGVSLNAPGSKVATPLPTATIAPTTQKTAANTMVGYDVNNKGAQVFVKPGEYNKGISATPLTPQNINEKINENQATDFKNASVTEEPAVKSSFQKATDIASQLKSEITKGLGEEVPVYKAADQYKALRGEQGVTDLETSLNDLQTQARDIQAISAQRTAAERGKAVPMNVIAGRISEEEYQDNVRLQAINDSIKTVTGQLQTKYSMINDIMKYSGEDYATATNSYDKKFNQNLALLNAAKGIVDEEKTDQERLVDNARANLQIVYNNIGASGADLSKLDPTQAANITKLEVQSGMPIGFYKNVVKPGVDILTTVMSDDKSEAIVMYKDGTTKKIPTGFSKGVNTAVKAGGAGGKNKTELEAEEVEKEKAGILADINAISEIGQKMDGSPLYGKPDQKKIEQIRYEINKSGKDKTKSWFQDLYPIPKTTDRGADLPS